MLLFVKTWLYTRKRRIIFFIGIFIAADMLAGILFTSREASRTRTVQSLLSSDQSVRTYSKIYHHDLKPNQNAGSIWGNARYRLLTNSLGFRDKEIREVPLKSSRPRILLLGDSFTEGLGFDYDKTFGGIIQENFKKQGIEVLNAAVCSYSPILYFKKLQYLIETKALQFDEVVLFLDISDIPDELAYQENPDSTITLIPEEVDMAHMNALGLAQRKRSSAFMKFLKEHSLTLRFAAELKNSGHRNPLWFLTSSPKGNWTRDFNSSKVSTVTALKKAETHMDQLIKLLNTHNIKLTLVVYPWPHQIYYQEKDCIQTSFWSKWSMKNRVTFLNFFPDFINDRPWAEVDRDYFFNEDIHWNEKGHAFMAELFLKKYQPATPGKAA